jgi:hypothetical protein
MNNPTDLAKLVAEFQEPILQTGSSSTEQKLILNFALVNK